MKGWFNIRWRVRRKLGPRRYPWRVEYKRWWWPFWCLEETCFTEAEAVTFAKGMSSTKLIQKIP